MPQNINALSPGFTVDASIPLQAKGITLPDPVEQYGNALRLTRGRQEVEQGDLQLQQAQQTAAETNSLRARVSQADFSTLSPAQQIAEMQRVAPIAGQPIVDKMIANNKTMADTTATRSGTDKVNADDALRLIAGSDNANDLVQNLMLHVKQRPDSATAIVPLLQAVASGKYNDPMAFSAFQGKVLKAGLLAKDQFDAAQPNVQMVDSGGQSVPFNTKASAGPIGPVAGATSMPGTAKPMMTDRGLMSVAPDASSASYVPQGQSASGASAVPAWLGPEPTGKYTGDPATVRATIQRIKDPADRAAASRALDNQLAGGVAPPMSSSTGIGAKDYSTPESAKNFGVYEQGLNERVGTYQTLLPMIQQFRTALQGYQSGPSAETRQTLAKVVASIPGVDPNSALVQFVNRGPIANSQEIEKLQGTMALEGIKSILNGAGKIGQSEFRILEPRFPGIGTDPKATAMIFDLTERQAQQSFAEQQALDKAKGTPGADLTRFPAAWSQHLLDINALDATPKPKGGPVPPQTIDAILSKYR